MSRSGSDRLARILSSLSHLDLQGEIEQLEAVVVKAGLGSTCDVFCAWSKRHKRKIAVKRIRVILRNDERFAKRLASELRIWSMMQHECVLPLLGYYVEKCDSMPNLVSPWMPNGTVDEYMKAFPRGGIDTLNMLTWIALGLEYLHQKGVVHGDLKSKNILVSEESKPLLTDFGLSSALAFSTTINTTASTSGTIRWMAIELFNIPQSIGDVNPIHTFASDVWAFGMVGYELISGEVPYHNYRIDVLVFQAIIRGERPAQPLIDPSRSAIFFSLWTVCQLCWKENPRERPTQFLSRSLNGIEYSPAYVDRAIIPSPKPKPLQIAYHFSHLSNAVQELETCKTIFDICHDRLVNDLMLVFRKESLEFKIQNKAEELKEGSTAALKIAHDLYAEHQSFAKMVLDKLHVINQSNEDGPLFYIESLEEEKWQMIRELSRSVKQYTKSLRGSIYDLAILIKPTKDKYGRRQSRMDLLVRGCFARLFRRAANTPKTPLVTSQNRAMTGVGLIGLTGAAIGINGRTLLNKARTICDGFKCDNVRQEQKFRNVLGFLENELPKLLKKAEMALTNFNAFLVVQLVELLDKKVRAAGTLTADEARRATREWELFCKIRSSA